MERARESGAERRQRLGMQGIATIEATALLVCVTVVSLVLWSFYGEAIRRIILG